VRPFFSVLICVYIKENPAFLEQCIESILSQTVLPDELVIVKDGPLTEQLERVLRSMDFPNELRIISLSENVTQGPARAIGLEAASYEWVAIMDSDDICRPDRFEKQLEMIAENPRLGLIGGQVSEFDRQPKDVVAVKTVPLSNEEIVNYAKSRNPFNQMTVMLKRDEAIMAGNYRYFPCFEDYDLWVRMINNGVKCENHPDVLVDARVGSGMYERRRGVSYIRYEWKMQLQLKSLDFIGIGHFIKNVLLRIPIRLLPGKWTEFIYNRVLRG